MSIIDFFDYLCYNSNDNWSQEGEMGYFCTLIIVVQKKE